MTPWLTYVCTSLYDVCIYDVVQLYHIVVLNLVCTVYVRRWPHRRRPSRRLDPAFGASAGHATYPGDHRRWAAAAGSGVAAGRH